MALALAAAACLASCSGRLGHRSVRPTGGSLPLPAGLQVLRIEIQNGRLEVRPGGRDAVAYEGHIRCGADTAEDLQRFEARGAELRLEADPAAPGTWVLRGPTRPPELMSGVLGVEVRVTAPRDLPLEVRIEGSCDIDVADREAPTSIETRRGDVKCMACHGATRVRVGTGVLIVNDHRGDLDIETRMGQMQVFVREPGELLRLVSGNGDVQCIIPPSTGFRVDARAETGKVHTSFGLPVDRVTAYSAVMTGQRGDGRTEIVLRTGSGHLSLSHKTFD
ncbi:MAG: hypothetical protein AB7O97_13610 [Planctomycetota bacterium]